MNKKTNEQKTCTTQTYRKTVTKRDSEEIVEETITLKQFYHVRGEDSNLKPAPLPHDFSRENGSACRII